MRILIILTFLVFSRIAARAHEFKMGLFEINRQGDELSLFVRLDRLNLLEAIHCDNYNQIESCFFEYVNERMILLINDQHISPEISDHNITEDFVEIEFTLTDEINQVKLVEFTNTCLVAEVEDHINLLKLNLNGQKRTFKLDKDRMSTKINYL